MAKPLGNCKPPYTVQSISISTSRHLQSGLSCKFVNVVPIAHYFTKVAGNNISPARKFCIQKSASLSVWRTLDSKKPFDSHPRWEDCFSCRVPPQHNWQVCPQLAKLDHINVSVAKSSLPIKLREAPSATAMLEQYALDREFERLLTQLACIICANAKTHLTLPPSLSQASH